jgi:hypothetical protein
MLLIGSKDIIKQFCRMDASFVLSWLFPGRVAGLSSRHGPVPNKPLETLVSWVEQGIVPGVLPATRTGEGDVEVTRDLCNYPQKLVYQEGDVNPASSLRASRYIVAANKDPIVSTDKSARIVTCSYFYQKSYWPPFLALPAYLPRLFFRATQKLQKLCHKVPMLFRY